MAHLIGEPVSNPLSIQVNEYEIIIPRKKMIEFYLRKLGLMFVILMIMCLIIDFMLTGFFLLLAQASPIDYIKSLSLCNIGFFTFMGSILIITLYMIGSSKPSIVKLYQKGLYIQSRFSPFGHSSEIDIEYDNINEINRVDFEIYTHLVKPGWNYFRLTNGAPRPEPSHYFSINASKDNLVLITLKRPMIIHRMLPSDGWNANKIRNYKIDYVLFEFDERYIDKLISDTKVILKKS